MKSNTLVSFSPAVVRRSRLGGAMFLLAAFLPFEAAAATSENFFVSDGVRLRYQDEGIGEPVLLIHGYTASGDLNWRFPGVIAELTPHYRVITIDNRGHGGSDKPITPEAYGKSMVDDAVRLLDHLGLESAHVVGYSMGGMIALRLLADHPQRVRTAVVAGMGWTRADEETRERYRHSESYGGNEVPAPLLACLRSFGDLGLTREEIEAIRVPTTLVVGENDGLLARSVNPLRGVRPDFPLVIVPGATHAGAPFKREFRTAIREWLDAAAPIAVATSQ